MNVDQTVVEIFAVIGFVVTVAWIIALFAFAWGYVEFTLETKEVDDDEK